MRSDEYANYDGLGLADLVRRGEASREEVTEAAIDLALKHDPSLNAICFRAYDAARDRARAKDSNRSTSGPFDGVPFLLKDLAAELEGWPTRRGSRAFADLVSAQTDTLTQRYLDSGVVPLGKTTTPELGLIAVTESELYGDTRNPWNLEYTPGASSGGSAAAVAAGIVPMAHANDGGGSIRIPASCCGLVGLKPSRGRTPVGPLVGEMGSGLAHQHVVTRTVRDCAAMLDATGGPELGDVYGAPPRIFESGPASYLAQVTLPPKQLRIAYDTRFWLKDASIHPECVAAVEGTVALLSDLGHEVEEARPEIDYRALMRSFGVLWSAGAAAAVAEACELGQKPDDCFEPFTLELAARGKSFDGAATLRARQEILAVGRPLGRFHQTYDISVTTVLGSPPLRIGDWDRSTARLAAGSPARDFMLCSQLANATGQPSMSLPLHWTADGLPIGVMFTAAFGREDLLYRLAGQLEQAKPWAQRRPGVWG